MDLRKTAVRLGRPLLAFPVAVTCAALVLSSAAIGAEGDKRDNPLLAEGSWADIREDIIGSRLPALAAGIIDLDAPYRAHDAATVPIRIKQPGPNSPAVERALLIIDENPAPVAAEMTFGAAMHPLDMEFRVRVNQYSNVRLIADTQSGPVMDGRYVKASGGCSAPATKSPELALSQMGLIRVRHFAPPLENASNRREAQIMIRHPNYSGLQRDQITQLFISAHFVNFIEVKQGDDVLFTLEGGISLSENPVIRFTYNDNGTDDLRVRAEDTEGNVWEEVIGKNTES